MSKVSLHFSSSLTRSDPLENPVIIIGQLKNLTRLSFNDVRVKLEPRVTEEVYSCALAALQPSPTDVCPLYRNMATLAALPSRCSRHNSPAHPSAITKLVRSSCVRVNEYVVIVCERADVLPSACAVARAYPLFTRKTLPAASNAGSAPSSGAPSSGAPPVVNVRVEFVILPSAGSGGGADERIALTDEDLRCLADVAFSIRLTARIVDTPCNEMNVEHFTQEISNVAAETGAKMRVIKGEELREAGFGGIYGVGKAARVPPALVVLSHCPDGATQNIAWVGKGIVYDSGGLSIKSRTGMPGMKRDCGGAAAILGAFRAVVKQGFSENLHAVFCLAENSVGPDATRPDDIHLLYSGRTVEINNTDAEGRLVLADGVAYAHKDLKANVILDMATLTGAQGICTGRYHAAVLSNREEWEQSVVEAGRSSGDLAFPIPFCPELHFPEFSSVLADMKNSVADRNNAQSSCAGLFILAQLSFDFPGAWIHVDMASPVYSGERATGYGVALLATLFGQYSKASMLHGVAVQASNGVIEEGNACKKIKRL